MVAWCAVASASRRARPLAGAWVAMLLIPALLAAVASPAEAAKVTTGEGELPSERVGAAAVHVGDGIVYVFGGRSGPEYLDEIVKYDTKTGRSTVVGDLPMPVGFTKAGRQAMSYVYTGSKIFLFGGAALRSAGDLNGDGNEDYVPASIPDIVEFDPATEEATRLTLDKLPSGAWGSAAVWYEGKAYVFGGFTFDITQPDQIQRRDWVLTFDPSASAGSRVRTLNNALPFRNQDMSAAVIGTKAYLFGGLGDNNTANPCPQVEFTDPETGETSMVYQSVCATAKIVVAELRGGDPLPQLIREELPQRNQFSAAAVVGEKVFILGGRATDGSAFSSILEFDAAGPKVNTLFPTLPGGRFGMPATVHGEEVRLLGGRDAGQFRNGMKDVLVFTAGATEPWAPRNLQATPSADGSGITLTWEPPTYDGGGAIQEYRVYRIDADGVKTKVGATAGDLSFSDESATPGSSYIYRVTSVNKFGESPTGAERDTRASTRPPSAPTAFQVFPGNGHALLRWLPPASDGGSEIGGYNIYRGSDAKPIDTVGADVLEYEDSTVTNGEEYFYRVSAFNGKGSGPATDATRVVPAAVPSGPTSVVVEEAGAALKIRWDASPGDVRGYRLYKGTEPDHLSPLGEGLVDATEYTDEVVSPGRLYYYAIAAENVNGEGAWSQVASGGLLNPPSAPRTLLLTPGPGFLNLSWVQPEDLGGAEKVTYLVTRKGPDGQPVIIARNADATRFQDRQVLPGLTYSYTVTAVNGRTGPASQAKSGAALEPENAAPLAKLSVIGSTRASVEEPMSFDASLSSDPDGRIVTYEFDWGDGTKKTVSDVPQVTKTYYRDGCFTVTMTTVDDRGARSAEPAKAFIEIGSCGREGPDDPNYVPPPAQEDQAPGTKTSRIPAPGAFAALAALGAAVALVGARRRDS